MTVINRGVFVTRWDPELVFSFMAPGLVKGGVAAACRMHAEFEVSMINTPVLRGGTIPAALIWCDRAENHAALAEDWQRRLPSSDAKVDGAVHERAPDKKVAS
jgi:hypothetical protein